MTFSIVARDPETQAFGVATATGGPAVGSLVPYGRAGAGAIATQGYTTNPLYGFDGIDKLATGMAAADTLAELTGKDQGRERRQCVMIDKNGTAAAWSGAELSPYAGSILKQDCAVAGNLLAGPEVLAAMCEAFAQGVGRPLATRLLAALTAAQAQGGDRRGTKSAAIKVYTTEPYPAVDVRVDWSGAPIAALSDILKATHASPYSDFFATLPTRANPSSS